MLLLHNNPGNIDNGVPMGERVSLLCKIYHMHNCPMAGIVNESLMFKEAYLHYKTI
jgi:hypothetical protein